MFRFPTGCAVLLLLVSLAPDAGAQEAWELGDAGWSETAKPDPLTPVGQLQLLRRDLVAAQGKEAGLLTDEAKAAAKTVEEKATLWLKSNPRHPHEPEGLLLRGDALFARGKYWQALYDYEKVARNFTATPSFTAALERERRTAELFLGGWRRKFLWLPIVPTREEGVELLVRIQERVPGSPMAEEAGLRLGDWYFETADMEMAVEAYTVFLLTNPQTKHESFVLRRIIEASMARFNGPKFDSTGLIEARQRIAEYKKKYPSDAEKLGSDALLLRIEESLALRDLYNARWYERRGEHVSAVLLLRRIVVSSPATKAAREAKEQLVSWNEPLVDPRDPAAVAAAQAAAKSAAKKGDGK